MGKIKKITENELVGGTQSTDVYPVTSIKAVYDESNERLDNILNRRGVVNISTNYNADHIAEVLTLEQAIAKVPSKDRVLGFQGKFLSENGWKSYVFIGDSIADWTNKTKWNNYLTGTDIVQESGDAEDKVMSQKVLSDKLSDLASGIGCIEFSKSAFINAQTKKIQNSNEYRCTDYILIDYAKKYLVKNLTREQGGVIAPMAYFDADKTFISTNTQHLQDGKVDINMSKETIPSNAMYVVFSSKASYNAKVLMLRDYYFDGVQKSVAELEHVNKINNMINENKIFSINAFINGNTGNIVSSTEFVCTTYIPIDYIKGKVAINMVLEQGGVIAPMAYFDADKTFISTHTQSLQNGKVDIDMSKETIPSNAVYVVFSSRKELDYRLVPLYDYQQDYIINSYDRFIGVKNSSIKIDTFGDSFSIKEWYRNQLVYVPILSNEKRLLNRISFKGYNKDSFDLIVGVKDQRNWFIPSKRINIPASLISVSDTTFTVDMSSLYVTIDEGESFCIDLTQSDLLIGRTEEIEGVVWATTDINSMFTKTFTPSLLLVETEKISLGFPTNSEFSETNKKIASNSDKINSIAKSKNILKDLKTGEKYKMYVLDGVLSIKKMQYEKIAFWGNSLMGQGTVASYNWYGGGRGMAASVDQHDYISYVMEGIQKRNNATYFKVTPSSNDNSLERKEKDFNCEEELTELLSFSPDCIIIQLGENIISSADWQEALENVVAYINTNLPLCDIYITDRFWSEQATNIAAYKACESTGATFVSIADLGIKENEWRLGDYTQGSGENKELYYMNTEGVAKHPSDIGFCLIADRMLQAMGYDGSMNHVYKISISNTTEASVTCTQSRMPEGSIVSIKVDGEISSLAVNDGNVSTTRMQNEYGIYYVFTMPGSDANIIVS